MKLFAIWIGKLAILATRITKTGGGTTLPGLLAEKIDKNIINKLTSKLKYGAIVVTGTNGKTTTAKMLVEILNEAGFKVLHNSSGSNLTRGIASSLIYSVGLFGFNVNADIAVFEVDEATMSEATTKVRPNIVMVTNLFRDQLDRYGELDKTALIVGGSLRGFSKMTTILNADDPLVASLSKYVEGPIKYFGLSDGSLTTQSRAAMDSKDCVECGHELEYKNRHFGHLGDWSCKNCGQKRPKLDFSVSDIQLTPEKSKFNLDLSAEKLSIDMPIMGLYNVYNALAAAAAADLVSAGGAAVSHALRNFAAAFGRMETIDIDGRKVMILLVKNPTGANQAFEAVFSDKKPKNVLFALNDNFADGTDVSWIWDIDFESMDLTGSRIITSGIRAEDATLRFKYSGVAKEKISTEKDPVEAVRILASITEKGGTCYVFPTYTAMIEIRNAYAPKNDVLAELGKVTKHGM